MPSIEPNMQGRARRTLFAAAALAVVAAPGALYAQETSGERVVPTSRIYNPDGSLAGFATNEPDLYFLAPSGWDLLERGGRPAAVLTEADDTTYDLRIALRPNYERAAPAVAVIRHDAPDAFFFPLPIAVDSVTLFLPPELGSVAAELTPDEQLPTPIALYYRLRLTPEQLEVFRSLANQPLALQGVVEYTFADGRELLETTAPLTIGLAPEVFEHTGVEPPSPLTWLDDLLTITQLYVPGALDGRYSLGSGFFVTLEHTLVSAHFVHGAYELEQQEDGRIVAVPAGDLPNIEGEILLRVRELGFDVRLDFEASIAIELDLASMRVSLLSLAISDARVNGVSSPFYRRLLQRLVERDEVVRAISGALTRELQRRILAETLFGAEVES